MRRELLLANCLKAIERARLWLRDQDNRIDQIDDLCSHYKAPYLYAVLGDRERARRYSDLIGRRYLQEDGDFRTSSDSKGWKHLPCSPTNRYVYSNGWIIVGLQKIGAFGMARKGLDFVRRFQHSKLGGFCSGYDIGTGTVDTSRLDTSSSSSAGMALLACGQIEEAVRAGDFVVRVVESNPEPAKFFFSSWETERGLMTDVFGDEDQNAPHGRKQYCLSAEADASQELVWLMGKPMAFLCRLYDATNDDTYLQTAKKLFSFFDSLDDRKWSNPASCKVMWSGGDLYRLTADRSILGVVERLLQYFINSQYESGSWVHTLWYEGPDDQPFPAALDLVQELTAEISDTVYNLADDSVHSG
ncbi:MAG: hypothetical protein ACWGQW_16175 [bacterium]